jgi:acyl carrier protein
MLKDNIIKILSEIRPEFEFSENLNFIEQGMLDSFDIVSLVVELDSTFQISIKGTEIIPENFSSVAKIEDLLNKYGIQNN